MIDPSLYPLDPDQELQADDSIDRLFVNRKSRFTQVEGPELKPAPPAVGVQPGLSYVKFRLLDGTQRIIELRPGETYTMPLGLDFMTVLIDTTKTKSGSTNADQYKLPLLSTGSYNFLVEWGDGSSDTITSWNQAQATHTYATSGIYTIKMAQLASDGLKRIDFANGDEEKLRAIESWGDAQITFSDAPFNGCKNLLGITEVPTLIDLNFVGIAFFQTQLLNVCDFSSLGTAANPLVINNDWSVFSSLGSLLSNASEANFNFYAQVLGGALSMFASSKYNGPLDKWDMSGCTNTSSFFSGASEFNQDISGWDVSSVTSMQSMFQNAAKFNQDIGSWDVSSVTTMQFMFQNAAAFDQDLGSWNIGLLTNASAMFTGSGLTTPNYDALLIGWAAQALSIQSGVTLSSVPCNYTIATAQAARDVLTGIYGWTIIDQGGI